MKKKSNGITLVALVITIVILLILAGISISALTNTGIFQKAKDAKQKSEDASEKEQSLLYEYEDELSKYTSNDRWDGKVNKPEIMTGMTAIKFTEPTGNTEDTKGKEEKVSDSSKNDWYNYSEKKWANAKTNDGSMWVWIPRYAYKINKSNQTFDVVFLVGTTDSYYDKDGKLQTAKRQTSETDIPDATKNYVVHPAFTNESSIGYANGGWRKELTGIWISKFEAGYVDKDTFNANKAKYTSSVNYTQVTGYTPAEKYEDASNYLNGIYGSNATKITYPTFQGGKYSMNYINHSDAFSISRALTDSNNIYKLSNKETDSHLIKNSEWGAVSYLGQSQYGLNGTNICINNLNTNNSEEYVYAKTGYASKNGNDSEATNSTNDVWKWNEKGGTAASCTGTIYGIYDMSGGTWERSAAIVNNGNDSGNLNTYGKAIMNALNNGKSSEYVTVYPTGESKGQSLDDASKSNYAANTKIYGDAIRETSTAGLGQTSWHDDYSSFVGATTHLCSSYAWDTAINFIQNNGFPNYAKVKEDSYNENWYDKSVKDLLGNIIKVANNATRLSTGETTSKCNIYDMGGNVAEFTTEVMPNTSEPVVVRGGHYNTNGLAGRRLDYSTSIAYDYVGFRVTLFLN